MKNTKLLTVFAVVCVVALAATGCKAKKEEVAAVAVTAPVVDLATIIDDATFTAAYDTVIASYTDTAAKIAAGDTTLATVAADTLTLAAGLDTAAETIKATLADQALVDFTAKADAYKAQLVALVPVATTETVAATDATAEVAAPAAN